MKHLSGKTIDHADPNWLMRISKIGTNTSNDLLRRYTPGEISLANIQVHRDRH